MEKYEIKLHITRRVLEILLDDYRKMLRQRGKKDSRRRRPICPLCIFMFSERGKTKCTRCTWLIFGYFGCSNRPDIYYDYSEWKNHGHDAVKVRMKQIKQWLKELTPEFYSAWLKADPIRNYPKAWKKIRANFEQLLKDRELTA